MVEFADCLKLVRAHLDGQNWRLLRAEQLASAIWQEWLTCQNRPLPIIFVSRAVARHYGLFLHDCLCDSRDEKFQAAWSELEAWIRCHMGQVTVETALHDQLVQDAIIKLSRHFANQKMDNPRALWSYTLTTMRNVHIDYRRRETAKKNRETTQPEDKWQTVATAEPQPEAMVAHNFENSQVESFLHQHITSDWQREIFILTCLEGRPPREVAQMFSVKPHIIRLAKSRAVTKLRQLPPEQLANLLALTEGNDEA